MSSMTEDQLIHELKQANRDLENYPHVRVSIGDDAAVIDVPEGHVLVTSVDDCCETTHFLRNWAPLDKIASKAVGAALSDLAAMGASPLGAMISLQFDSSIKSDEILKLLNAARNRMELFRCPLIGGNLAKSPNGLCLSISVFGSAPKTSVFLRSTAHPSQELWLSGGLGGSRLALESLLAKLNPSNTFEQQQVDRFFFTRPRFDVAELLKKADTNHPIAAMDVSDGLAQDLTRLLVSSGQCAQVDPAKIADSDLRAWCTQNQKDPVEFALNSGEEYELLFAIDPNALKTKLNETTLRQVLIANGARKIGMILSPSTEHPPGTITLSHNDQTFTAAGFDHLRRS